MARFWINLFSNFLLQMSFFTILLFLTFSFNVGNHPSDSLTEKSAASIGNPFGLERNISYEKGILNNRLDYQLLHGKKGKFILKFTNKPQHSIDIKIYDVIGNLIKTDKILQEEGNEKEYDFSDRETKIYVVKVSSEEENIVKKINI